MIIIYKYLYVCIYYTKLKKIIFILNAKDLIKFKLFLHLNLILLNIVKNHDDLHNFLIYLKN